ncbi:MAG: SCO1664 family protein [Pleurocapsa minor GSE-CHR-MK-17-07R]|jgi:hypothetical protein|nr:SCO1664 family protein [Pleurocapsa minor GSE-CHR-MK 17-07R]
MTEPELLPESKPISASRALEILQHGDIHEEYGMLRWSSNYAFLVAMKYEDDIVTAVYKPQKGERPLWDFPDGTLCHREFLSFLTSQALGWGIVPPTVLRAGSRGLGTFQFYIDHDPEQHYFTFPDDIKAQLVRMAAFDVIVNNADRKGGHCLLDATGHVWGIDHGITFHAQHKLRTVIWDYAGQPLEDDLLEDLRALLDMVESQDSHYRQSAEELISTGELRAFHRRLKTLVETGCYPTPGPGPNYPWPAV